MAQESIGDRIRRLRVAKRLKLREVGEALGISAQGVSNYEQGLSVPSTERVLLLAQLFEVSERYLLTGVKELDHGDTVRMTPTGGRVIPVYRAIDVVKGLNFNNLGDVTTHFPCGANSYAVPIWDESNAPEFQIGDQIVLDPETPPVPGDMVLAVVHVPSTVPIFGRYVRRLVAGQLCDVIQHLNTAWGEQALTDDKVGKVLAVMTEHARPRRR